MVIKIEKIYVTKLSINISAIMMNDFIRRNPDEVLMPDQYNVTWNYTEICTLPGWSRVYPEPYQLHP